ncbi:MAG: hypothetical protein ACAH17_03140 [Candidatus Paceibacterota bacterium]
MTSQKDDKPSSPFDRELFDLLEENPELREAFLASKDGVELRERIKKFSEIIRTGDVDEELCKSQALKMLKMETIIPGTFEPVYLAVTALIKEHGEEEGIRIAQERWAKHQGRIFHHVIELQRSFKR